jgi:hypothetical protein
VREVTVMEDFLFEEQFLVTRQFGSHGGFMPDDSELLEAGGRRNGSLSCRRLSSWRLGCRRERRPVGPERCISAFNLHSTRTVALCGSRHLGGEINRVCASLSEKLQPPAWPGRPP